LKPIVRIDTDLVVLSDLHSNGPSIREVARQIPHDAIVAFLGDAVGYYDEPNFVCDFLRDRANYAIAGNHDRYVTGQLPYSSTRESSYRIEWTKEQLTPQNLKWLEELPSEILLSLEPAVSLSLEENRVEFNSIFMAHGSPGNCEKYVYPDTEIDFDCDVGTIVLLGHTHHPMIRRTEFGVVINPGSVGQPRDYNPSSSYLLINTVKEHFEIKRNRYNHSDYARQLSEKGFDPYSIGLITRIK
jgi:predicted phosphodiesterase